MLWIAAIAVTLLGLAAAVLGFRGRRANDHPICRGCGFDLVGLGAGEGARCPECGRDLGRRRATRAGARRRRPVVLALGLVMLLAGLSWTGALTWGQASSFDWNTVKPTWLLMMETRQPTADNADAGMQELVKRLEAGELEAETVDTIVERIIETQGDADLPWHASWGDFVEAAHEQRPLDHEQLVRYLTQAVEGGLAPTGLNYMNSSLSYGLLRNNARAGSGVGQSNFHIRARVESIEVGGQTFDPKLSAFFGLGQSGATTSRRNGITLPAGDLDVAMQVQVDVIEQFSTTAEPITSWPLSLAATVEVDPDATVIWIDDPAMHPVFNEDHPQKPTARAVEGGARIEGFMHFESVPVGVVANVFARAGEREWKVGRLVLQPGFRGGINIMSMETLPDFDARTVDIILRSVVDEEPDASWPREVWRGELVIPDVPLKWTGGGPP